MRSFLIFIILFGVSFTTFGQTLFINELDCDTPGIDDKEFVELLSSSPNVSLNGYVLVFFNGSDNGGNTSYLALDLDGYTTDINGILLIGSTTVVPFPQYIIPTNVIQNGADAVAIYRGNAEDFPEGTLAFVDNTLVDVLLYDTSDADAVSMIEIFKAFNQNILQINEGNANNTNSVQRNSDGTYFSGVPTPRRLNDGSGIVIIGVLSIFEKSNFNEGETIDITFTTEIAVEEDFPISFTLSNGGFNNADFTGNTNVTIPKGTKTVTTTITIIDDNLDEGDEVMKLRISTLPSNYLPLNNNVEIRIVDNDFTVADFGTPINPTYGKVKGTFAPDYYDILVGLSDENLRNSLQNIVANPNLVRAQTYNDLIALLSDADENPENSNQVWLVYLEKGRPKLDFQLSSDNANTWNREHTWPRSRGGFNSIEADETIDGPNIFWPTNADSTRHANSDAHAIRAVDGPENSSRGNQFYGEYNGPAGTLGGFKGDVARGIFYLDVRYNGLEVVNGYPEGQVGKFGDLATLLDWHRNDPVDDYEMNRNNVVYAWQNNRNPFIDNPEMVEYFWGNKVGQPWQKTSSTKNLNTQQYKISPNPTHNLIHIAGIETVTTIEILNANGLLMSKKEYSADTIIDLHHVPKGLYYIKLTNKDGSSTQSVVLY
jgi:Endonuclease I/Secretion system C-terminal sorting domain